MHDDNTRDGRSRPIRPDNGRPGARAAGRANGLLSGLLLSLLVGGSAFAGGAQGHTEMEGRDLAGKPAEGSPAAEALLHDTEGGGGPPEVRKDVVAVVAPTGTLEGRVLEKDGITPLPGVELSLRSVSSGMQYGSSAARGGRFKMRVPIGVYSLRIRRGNEIYESPSVYSISAGSRLDIDFLLLRYFEPADPPADGVVPRNPDAGTEASAVVGSVVDMLVPEKKLHRGHHWGEWLGLIGSILAVALASQ